VKRLGGWDAVMLYSETPNIPTHTLKISVIDPRNSKGNFTFDRFRRVVERRLPVLEPLRFQLVDIPFKLHHPMWLEEAAVDLDFHLRRATVPSPGGRREFDALVGQIAEGKLDRSRPLWEMHFAEGLADGKVAVIVKVHHALADGVASANLLARALDSTVTTPNHDHARSSPPRSASLLRAAGRDHVEHLKRLPSLLKDTATGSAKVRRRSQDRGRSAGLARTFGAPKTFINHRVSPGRRFATATFALAQAKATSRELGISLNDLVLVIASGALRELLLRHDGTADRPMIASVPVSSDPSTDRISGNAVGGLLVSLPVQFDDLMHRVRLVSMSTANAKRDNELRGPDLMGRWTEYLPPPVTPAAFGFLARRAKHNRMYNLSISNVRGPRVQGSVANAPISEFYSVGPLTPGSGMNITVWSYVDQLNVSVLTDDSTMEDAHEVTESMTRQFAELMRAAGLPSELVPVDTAMPPASAVP
jgi:diacylglycerol O-acyltransferase / wax synthase